MSPGKTFDGLKEDESRLVALLIAGMLVFSPLIQGGNTPLSLLFLELLSLVLLARLVFVPSFRWHLSGWGMVAVAAAVLLPLFYLIPLPFSVWGGLPGRAQYAELIGVSQDGGVIAGSRAVSIIPFESERGWYTLLFPLAVFLVTVGLPERRIQMLVRVFLCMAAFQALLGLAQFVQGPESYLRFGNPFYPISAVGTYVNRNHLAGLLYMALPVALAILVSPVGKNSGGSGRNTSSSVADTMMLLLVGTLPIVLLIGLVFTRSRAGIGLGALGLLLTALMFSVQVGKRKLLLIVGAVFLIGLFVVLMIGMAPVIARFASPDTIDNERWAIFSASIQAAHTFMPIGAGPATFPEVFPFFQPDDMSGFVNRVHNDYLEVYFDGGLVLFLPVAALVLWYLFHWRAIWEVKGWSRFRLFQSAAGVSLLLMLLHSAGDFNLHIPANMGYFAFLAGIFMRRSSSRGRQSAKISSSLPAKGSPRSRGVPDENLVNPFITGKSNERSHIGNL